VLIVMLLLMAIGLAAVIDSIGRRRLLRRLALTSLLLGAGCGTLAALINGFILPTTAAQLAGSDAESLSLLVSLCLNANAVLARVCVLGLSTHAAICGIGLWPWGGLRRIAAIAGLTCGLLSPALLLIGSLPMNVGGFGSFVAIHSLWSILAGFSLVDSRSETPGSEAAI
jgi:hypothetical protein